jgi:hypothetical protein
MAKVELVEVPLGKIVERHEYLLRISGEWLLGYFDETGSLRHSMSSGGMWDRYSLDSLRDRELLTAAYRIEGEP